MMNRLLCGLLLIGAISMAAQDKTAETIRQRAAFRKQLYSDSTYRTAIQKGLKDPDPEIRAAALYELYLRDGDKAVPELRKYVNDPSVKVGKTLAEIANGLQNKELRQSLLQELISKTKFHEVKKIAGRGFFDFYRNNVPLSQDPAYDHELKLVKKIPLPEKGWLFRPDPMETGHVKGWYKPDFKDVRWSRLSVIQCWEAQGYDGYDGIAWYRVKFTMPPKMDCTTVELSFGAVDECAWVWLNGKYIGQHDLGPDGWKVPFKFNISKEIRWGGENILAVRVLDTLAAGGIWKPVSVEVLK